jgi:hypothetical protein
MEGLAKITAKAYDKDDALQEGILILCKTQKEDKGWFLAEIDKIYSDEIVVSYYATPRPSLDNYEASSKEQRMEALGEACFRKTWYLRQGKNAGKATNKAPFPLNPELRLWTGKLPLTEREELILAIGITLDHKGLLSKGSLLVASQLDIGHEAAETVEDQEEQLADLRIANSLFCYAEATLCNCSRCKDKLTQTRNNTKKRKQDATPSQINRAASYQNKQRSYSDQAETQPDRMSTREEATPRAPLAT